MLTRLRNSNFVKSRKVNVIRTNLVLDILNILKSEGFIDSFDNTGDLSLSEKSFVSKYVSVNLRYKGVKQKPYITQLKRISKPGLRVYVSKSNIPRVLGGIGVAVFKTYNFVFN
jgi:small subunit ribosomal protein S8